MRRIIFLILIGLVITSYSQEIKVKGGFIEDSLKIGQNVGFWLSARYPSEYDLVLPDSNFNFTPFEFGDRNYFETLADSANAIDSVIYQLQSFEIDPIQYLNLPAMVLIDQDTTIVQSELDSIFLVELVKEATDTTKLITNTAHQNVPGEFNSPLLLIVLGLLVVIALVVLVVFGKKIKRHFTLKRMARAHDTFLDKLASLISKMKDSGEPETAEQAINIWKKYLEKIEKQPFTKLTSKEIIKYDFAEELQGPLKEVDRCVYGKLPSETVYQDFQHLEDFAQNRYDRRISTIKQG